MKRRTLLATAAAMSVAGRARAATKITFWHAMNGPLGEEVNRICTSFNASQGDVTVEPVFKGGYAETLTAAIAATSAKALYSSGLKADKQTFTRVGILAVTAFVAAKDLYGPWVTVAALHATAVSGLNLATTVVDRLT